MATSPNNSFNMTRDEIIRTSLRLVGKIGLGEEPNQTLIKMASDLLNIKIKALQARGLVLRTIQPTTLALSVGVATYTITGNIVDIVFPATIVLSGGVGETEVQEMTRGDWILLYNKNQQGIPTRMYVQKQETMTVTLWPVPNSSAPTLRFSQVRLLKDMDQGTYNLDLSQLWLDAMVHSLAHDLALAFQMPTERVAYIKSLRDEALALVESENNETDDINFFVSGG